MRLTLLMAGIAVAASATSAYPGDSKFALDVVDKAKELALTVASCEKTFGSRFVPNFRNTISIIEAEFASIGLPHDAAIISASKLKNVALSSAVKLPNATRDHLQACHNMISDSFEEMRVASATARTAMRSGWNTQTSK